MHNYKKSCSTGKVSGIRANTIELKQQIAQGEYDAAFTKLYGAAAVQEQRKRYTDLINEFEKAYGTERTVRLYSAPGRTEIGGNHTDHNNGVVLAGSVNLDMVAVVSPNEENVIRVKSLGFDKIDDVDVNILTPQPREAEHSASLIRGVAKGIVDAGGKVGGFDCYSTSNVLRGSGLSSSAAFEVCIGAILRGEYNNNDMGKFSQVKIAQIGQYAENVFFGKPCACSTFSVTPAQPIISEMSVSIFTMGEINNARSINVSDNALIEKNAPMLFASSTTVSYCWRRGVKNAVNSETASQGVCA